VSNILQAIDNIQQNGSVRFQDTIPISEARFEAFMAVTMEFVVFQVVVLCSVVV